MTKQELIDQITEKCRNDKRPALSKADTGAVLDKLQTVLAEALARGDTAEIPGVVRLKREQRAARTGRNPQTGETLQIPARKVVAFRRVKRLEDTVGYYEDGGLL